MNTMHYPKYLMNKIVEIQATLLKEVVVIIINIQKYQQLSQPKGLSPPWDPWLALRPDPTKGLSASGLVEPVGKLVSKPHSACSSNKPPPSLS
jgi:hypothetical protein